MVLGVRKRNKVWYRASSLGSTHHYNCKVPKRQSHQGRILSTVRNRILIFCMATICFNNSLATGFHRAKELTEIIIRYCSLGLVYVLTELVLWWLLLNPVFVLDIVLHLVPYSLYRVEIYG